MANNVPMAIKQSVAFIIVSPFSWFVMKVYTAKVSLWLQLLFTSKKKIKYGMNKIINPKICPFCGKDNNCMAGKNIGCWCDTIKVPMSLREFIAPEQRMKACICKACILLYKEDEIKFKEMYIKEQSGF